ncbi:hypothetical protein LSH36_108g03049 [Paralvinella palmiformis]|uniref:protein-serine/threonine phosphatase n=1 Tax=Paralvinella palmiformis TaxID=53620 RepID=A0AAD9K019_9ANNE|nr:hypothetical protein LSH36_108g03049 [Paralvinella palmiformis]
MALVTVQRSPSPSDTPDTLGSDLSDLVLVDGDSSCKSAQRSRNLSESYVSFKGAALILPQSECQRTVTKGVNTGWYTAIYVQDSAIKLESTLENLIRYMAVVSTTGVHDTEECAIIGVDIQQEATIGLVLPVWADMTIKLDGDGGFSITTDSRHHIFKPLSVQAMWSAWQCLNKINDIARIHNYYPSGLTHTWVQYYKVTSSQHCINEWDAMEDLESQRPELLSSVKSSDVECLEHLIRAKLKEIMMTVDLEEVTSKYLRERLEEDLDKCLKPYKQFIDQEMIVILRQMDSPSKIFDFLYLGSEWNASNLEELSKNRIGYILNVTREIDNFFPGLFKYKNIRVYDVEEADLLKYWEETYRFISEARWDNSKVLVHCKMGVSRSASTVISFVMKEKRWSLDEAYKYVKGKRSVIKPNDGFLKQLKMYEGILTASNQRHNKLWRSTSVGNLIPNTHSASGSREQTKMATSIPTLSSSFGSHRHDSLPILTRQYAHFPSDNFDSMDVSSDDNLQTSDDDDCGGGVVGDDDDDGDDDEPIQFMMEGDVNSSPQSLDQWNEVFRGEMAETEDAGRLGHPQSGVVLISQNKTSQRKDLKYGRMQSDSESGNETIPDGEPRHVAGGYDIVVLEAVQKEALSRRGTDVESGGDKAWSPLHLHPDIIAERTTSHSRTKYMVRRMRKRQRTHMSERDGSMPIVVVSDLNQSAGQKSAAAAVRVKPDDFWIKDDQLSVISQVQAESAESMEVIIPTPVAHHLSQSPQPNVSYASPVGSTTSDTSESIQAYIKEDIPWSPGTVRRQAQDLECRLTTASVPVLSDLSSSPQCRRQMVSSASAEPASDTDTPSQSFAVTSSPISDGQPSDLSSWSLTGAFAAKSGYQSDGGSTASTSLDSPVCSPRQSRNRAASYIYESEDIPLEPGHVLRTKLEIEHRERSCSYSAMSPDKETRPVQRSSSCKDERHSSSRGRFDRSSDRRRTCLPVLHPSPTSEKPFTLTSPIGSDSCFDIKRDVASGQKVVYTIGDDALEIEQGKVRRHTRDFEGAVFEDKEPSSKVKPVTDTLVQDEVEVLIRQGSVKRTKQDMMERFGASSKPLSVGDGTQQTSLSGKTEGEESYKTVPASSTDVLLEDKACGTTASQSGNSNGQFVAHSNHAKLKHSQSSPQLCLGSPAYPEEEEITWSVGTVLQQKEAIERKGKTLDEKNGEAPFGLKSSLSCETLRLIRQVGTAWLESAERRASGEEEADVRSGPGLVRRLSDQMQGKSASEEIKKRMLMLEKKDCDLDDGANSQWRSCMFRSASMRESSRLKAASVNRSRSVKERKAAKGVCDKCFTIREGKPISKSIFTSNDEVGSKAGGDNIAESNELTSCGIDEAVLNKDPRYDSSKLTNKIDSEKKSNTKDIKKYFETPATSHECKSKPVKSHLKRTKSDGLRNVTSDGVYKSSISVSVSSGHTKDSSETSGLITNQNLVSQTGRSILIKTVSDPQESCIRRRNVSDRAKSRAESDEFKLSDSVLGRKSERVAVGDLKDDCVSNRPGLVGVDNSVDTSCDVGADSSTKKRSSVPSAESDKKAKKASSCQRQPSKQDLTQARNVSTIKTQYDSASSRPSSVTKESVSADVVTGISGTGRKRLGSQKNIDPGVPKQGDPSCSERCSCLDHKHSGFTSESVPDRVSTESRIKPEIVVSKDIVRTDEQQTKLAKISKRPLAACEQSTAVVLNPVFKEQAIKALFPEHQIETRHSASHMGVQGTRRHRRSTVPLRQHQNVDAGRGKGSKTERERAENADGKHRVTQTEADCREKEQLQRVRKLHGRSHPLTRLTQVENGEGGVMQGRCPKPFYNSL